MYSSFYLSIIYYNILLTYLFIILAHIVVSFTLHDRDI